MRLYFLLLAAVSGSFVELWQTVDDPREEVPEVSVVDGVIDDLLAQKAKLQKIQSDFDDWENSVIKMLERLSGVCQEILGTRALYKSLQPERMDALRTLYSSVQAQIMSCTNNIRAISQKMLSLSKLQAGLFLRIGEEPGHVATATRLVQDLIAMSYKFVEANTSRIDSLQAIQCYI